MQKQQLGPGAWDGPHLRVCVTAPGWTGLAGSWGSMKEIGGDGGMFWTRQHGLCVSKSWCSCCCKVIVLLHVMCVVCLQ